MRAVFVLPTVFILLCGPRISAGGASHLGGPLGLRNWRRSRLQTVYRSTEIGTRSGLRLGNTGLRSPAWSAGVGLPTLADVCGSPFAGVGRRSPTRPLY